MVGLLTLDVHHARVDIWEDGVVTSGSPPHVGVVSRAELEAGFRLALGAWALLL